MAQPADTTMGGGNRQFPVTRWSLIRAAADRNSPACRTALEHLCELYWKPAYAYVRASRSVAVEEAKDLTQAFFLELVEGGMLERYSPDLGSFRGYLRGAMSLFLRDAHRRQTRLKHGGGRKILSLDTRVVDSDSMPGAADPDSAFDEEWVRTLLDLCLRDLKEDLTRTGREAAYRLYEKYEIDRPADGDATYGGLAREFGMTEQDVASALRLARRKLRTLLVERIQDYVSGEHEAAEELDRILGQMRA